MFRVFLFCLFVSILGIRAHAQTIHFVKKVELAQPMSSYQYIIPLKDRGIMTVTPNPKPGIFDITQYGTDLKWLSSSEVRLNKIPRKYSMIDVITQGNAVNFYFEKGSFMGFFPRSKFIHLKAIGSSSSITKYYLKNKVLITGVEQYNGKTLVSGIEMYKPLHPWRIFRFAFPIFALATPYADTDLGGAVGIVTLVGMFFPTAPRTRPALIELNDGKATYIGRDRFKSRMYKNKGIHDTYNDDENHLYLGITNALRPGKKHIIIERLNSGLKLETVSLYGKGDKKRVSGFEFLHSEGDTVYFTGGYGGKVVSTFGSIRYQDPKKDKAFDGYSFPSSAKKGKIFTLPSQLKNKNRGVNEIYSGSTEEVTTNTRKLSAILGGRKIEATISETVLGANVYGYVENESDREYIESNIVNLTLQIQDYSTGEAKTLAIPLKEFSHKEPSIGRGRYMHSAINVYRNNLIFTYLTGDYMLISQKIVFDEGAIEIFNEKIIDYDYENDENRNLEVTGVEAISDTEFMVIYHEIVKDVELKKEQYETFVSVYTITQ